MMNFLLFTNSLGILVQGATISIQLALLSLIIGVIGGTLLSLMLVYGNNTMCFIAQAYITIFRGTPMLVQIIALFFVLPTIGIVLPAFLAAVIAMGFNSIAYISEIIRAGIQAVSRGQIEAAQTLGFSHVQITRLIVLPQAIRTVFPALGNECITLIKDSSLASVIGVAELTHQASMIMSTTYDALTAYTGVAVIYLVLNSCVSLLLQLIERKMHYVKN